MWQEEVGVALEAGLARILGRPDGVRLLGLTGSAAAPPGTATTLAAGEPRAFRAQRPTARGQRADFTSAAARILAQRLDRADLAEPLALALAAEVRGADGVADAWARDGHVLVSVTSAALAGVVEDLLDAHRAPAALDASTCLPVPPARAAAARLAHARARNLTRSAHAHGVLPWPAGDVARGPALEDLVEESGARELILCLAGSRDAAARVHETHRPDPVIAHLDRTAAAHRAWFETTRVTPRGAGAITSAHRSRLCLNDAATPVLAGGLAILGLDAPEHL
ncbi:DALR anticodon-binding domain-containing protein [Occultella kanbiaonis]|uniref:DALR anticodon-binding domain-containing protein n=1 Tax=Occultella kanbiaonis TaxID=2675754 RepID=UPI00143CF0F8|nr:DALR anticodon-binding domain-containing protein [Occultella kanbiaonis]